MRAQAARDLGFLGQGHDAFEVSRLREEVEGLDRSEFVASFEEGLEITHLGGGITRDVDDFAGAEVEELLEEVFAAAFARRVDDDRGFGRGKGDVGEEVFGGSGDEFGVFDAVSLGVSASPISGGFGEFDADDFFEIPGEAESEKSGAAVGIEEVFLVRSAGFFTGVAGEGFEDEGVILEEIAREEVETEVADGFGDGGAVIGLNAAIGGTKKKSGPFFILGGIGLSLFANAGEGLIDLIHRDGAVMEIDETGAAVDLEEADRKILSRLGFLEVRGDLGAIAPFFRGGDGGADWSLDSDHVL